MCAHHSVGIVRPREEVVILRIPNVTVDTIPDTHELARVTGNGRVAADLHCSILIHQALTKL